MANATAYPEGVSAKTSVGQTKAVTRSLNTELRPRTLDEFIDATSVIGQIKESLRQGKIENTYLFSGPPGTGKTSLARVLAKTINALSSVIRSTGFEDQLVTASRMIIKDDFDIDVTELDTSDLSADSVRSLISSSRNNPWIYKYKCFIINEAQKLSAPAQEVMLDSLEEPCPSTIWFLCSSEPGKLSQALVRRCAHYKMSGLSSVGIGILVWKIIVAAKAHTLPDIESLARKLAVALQDKEVTSPGFVVKATEKLILGASIEEASQVQESSSVDTFAIAKAAAFGDWEALQTLLKAAPLSSAKDIRGKTAGFFRSILLKEAAGSKRAERCVWAIKQIADLANQNQFEDGLIWSATCAALYNVCISQKEHIKTKKE